ncbi:MAG: AraC family transcriptional regulator [Clostridia bacterium]|nr:AraC family transcriptional regulator [Clostridia bacterium]
MDRFARFVLKEITDVHTYHYTRGETAQITNRKWFGLSLCSRGQMTYTHNGKIFVSTPGHATFLPQGQSYTLRCDRDGDFHVINFTCEYFDCDTFEILTAHNEAALLDDYEYIRRLFVFERNRMKVRSLFYGMLDRLKSHEGEANYLLGPAMRCLESHIADPALNNRMLAKAAGVSEIYFRRVFSSHYGITPRQYILDIRMHKARQLLTEGALKVAEVAEACGFSSPYHFCRSFRERTGCTPGEYSRTHSRRGI